MTAKQRKAIGKLALRGTVARDMITRGRVTLAITKIRSPSSIARRVRLVITVIIHLDQLHTLLSSSVPQVTIVLKGQNTRLNFLARLARLII